jgi:hypothetical protein
MLNCEEFEIPADWNDGKEGQGQPLEPAPVRLGKPIPQLEEVAQGAPRRYAAPIRSNFANFLIASNDDLILLVSPQHGGRFRAHRLRDAVMANASNSNPEGHAVRCIGQIEMSGESIKPCKLSSSQQRTKS